MANGRYGLELLENGMLLAEMWPRQYTSLKIAL